MDGLRRRITLLAALALALAGCGEESQTPAEKAFGGLSERDEALADDVTADVRRFSQSYADFDAALSRGPDVEDARAAVDAMEDHIDKAIDLTADADNAEWRSTYERYLGTMERVMAVGQRIVAYLETPGPSRPKLEDRLAARLRAAADEATKADRALIERVTEHATPEEREQLERDLEEQSG